MNETASQTQTKQSLDIQIALEDGTTLSATITPAQRVTLREKTIGRSKFVEATFALADPLPSGYHELRIRAGTTEAAGTIFSAPLRCFAGETRRGWAMFTPLYALREHRDKPIGDLADLITKRLYGSRS